MAKNKINYEFKNGTEYTDVVPAVFAHINSPDEDFDRYSITVELDPDQQSTKDLFQKTLDFENQVREDNGLETVTIPSNWTRKGEPRKNDKGLWTPVFQMKTTNSKGVDQSPAIYNAAGEHDESIHVWGGDLVVVNFSIAVWYNATEAGSKYFLRAVQQVVSSGSPGGPQFSNKQENSSDTEDEGTETTEIPF